MQTTSEFVSLKSKLAIAVNVHSESISQLAACLSRIEINFPDAQRRLFINGSDGMEFRLLAERFGFSAVVGENLGTNRTWHIWWLRMLHFFDNTEADICFKFDPDTMVDKAPVDLPNADYFGQVQHSRYGFPFVQGGITGLSIRIVRKIINENLLEYSANKIWFCHPLKYRAHLADDQFLALVLQHLDVIPVAWHECKSVWKRPVLNESGEFSIVHPRYVSDRV